MSVAGMIRARPRAPARGKGHVAPGPHLRSRTHSFDGRGFSGKSPEGDPGHPLARLVRAPHSPCSDRGEGNDDRRHRLAFSLTDRGRGYPTGIRFRGGRQSTNAGRSALR